MCDNFSKVLAKKLNKMKNSLLSVSKNKSLHNFANNLMARLASYCFF